MFDLGVRAFATTCFGAEASSELLHVVGRCTLAGCNLCLATQGLVFLSESEGGECDEEQELQPTVSTYTEATDGLVARASLDRPEEDRGKKSEKKGERTREEEEEERGEEEEEERKEE